MNVIMSVDGMELASFVLFGVIVGYLLGWLCSNKQVFQMVLSKEDIEKAIEKVNKMNMEEEVSEAVEGIISGESPEAMEALSAKIDAENTGYHFYKVHLPIISMGTNPEEVYNGVLNRFKKFSNNRIGKNGVLVTSEAFVERLTQEESKEIINKN